MELAPSHAANARRLLLSAYLSAWPQLRRSARTGAYPVLTAAFENPQTLERALPRWMEVTAGRDEAYETLPDRSRTWLAVQRYWESRERWGEFLGARERWFRALRQETRALSDEAESHRPREDAEKTRERYLAVTTTAPVEASFAPIVDRALRRCPSGPLTESQTRAHRAWLRWALDHHLGDRRLLSIAAVRRLLDMSGELPLPLQALGVLDIGDLEGAARVERSSPDRRSPAWAHYYAARAQRLADDGEIETAQALLGWVHSSFRDRLLYRLTKARLDEASGRSPGAVAALGADEWPADGWSWNGDIARIELVAGRDAERLRLEIGDPRAGSAASSGTRAVADILWDGRRLRSTQLWPGARLDLPVLVEPGPHLLELRFLSRRLLDCGRVRLHGVASR
jgi:hypothetical protein